MELLSFAIENIFKNNFLFKTLFAIHSPPLDSCPRLTDIRSYFSPRMETSNFEICSFSTFLWLTFPIYQKELYFRHMVSRKKL